MISDRFARYSRHILLPEVGWDGQQKLLNSTALVIGLGGLGSPVCFYLAASGIGKLVIVDFDTVDLSNLQRQIIHQSSDIGRPKAESAKEKILTLNPDVEVIALTERLLSDDLKKWVRSVDVVVDCSDNFETRFELNRLSVFYQKPLVSGAAVQLIGQVSVFHPRNGPTSPCYHCLYPEAGIFSATCSQAGILAPLVGVIGSVQALEAVKVLLGLGEPLIGRLLLLEAKTLTWRTLKIEKDPMCGVCGAMQNFEKGAEF